MGTRGAYGLYKKGETKVTYNHFDSYPSGLGEDLVQFLRQSNVKELNDTFDRIELIDEQVKPTAEQIHHCKPWTDLGVSEQSEDDWYCLLRGAQGGLEAYRDGLKYMSDAKGFLEDSLFCEWAYVINLDENTFEVYEGYQHTYQENRYAIKTPKRSGYYSVRYLTAFPLEQIPENWQEQVEKLVEA